MYLSFVILIPEVGEEGGGVDHSGGVERINTGWSVSQTISMLTCELGFSRI
jgi:hypothetical protein